jgi:hypothetical protein
VSTPPASSAPVVVQPVVTSTATSRTVEHGTVVGTGFSVKAGGTYWAGKKVAVCVAVANAKYRCTDAVTSSTGTVQQARTATAGFKVYLYVYAGPGSKSAISATYTYTVRAKAGLDRTGSRTLTARVGGDSGQTVRLQRLDGSRWTTVAEYRATPVRTFGGLKAGARYRLTVTGTAAVAGAESRIVQL